LELVESARQEQILNYLMVSLLLSLLLVAALALVTVVQVEVLRFIMVQLLVPELWVKVIMEEPLVDILRYHTDPEAAAAEPAPVDMLDPATE
jgi:outer membrane biosynthesis protein TonB